MRTEISILMSIYNEPENYIRESVESILTQSLTNYELIIIVDNPQRKEIRSIIESYNDNRIRLYENQSNIGLALSMNKAATLASSNLLARMDADDIAEPDRLLKEFNEIKKSNCDFVFTNYSYIDKESKFLRMNLMINYKQENLSYIVQLQHIIHHPTVMFKRSVFEAVGGYRDFPCTQDLDLWFRMAENGCKFRLIDEPLLKYRLNDNSVSTKKWFKQKLTGNYIFDLSIERLLTGIDSYSQSNYKKYLQKWSEGNNNAERNLRKSQHYLSNAKSENISLLKKIWLRCIAFCCSSISRHHYFALKRKERILKNLN